MKKFSLPKDGGLIEAGLPNGIKHTFERIPAHIFEDEEAACARLAEKIVESINACNGVFKLGLTTGTSPVPLFNYNSFLSILNNSNFLFAVPTQRRMQFRFNNSDLSS
mgnify:CR=1 FL=1